MISTSKAEEEGQDNVVNPMPYAYHLGIIYGYQVTTHKKWWDPGWFMAILGLSFSQSACPAV